MIKFGTGGWRAIIADEFTKENVQKLAQAVSQEFIKKETVIGYDRRFLSDQAAKWFSEVLAANGIKVRFINKAVPTPMIMFAIKQLDLDYGMAITASHNPAIYNGVKLFTHGGKDATEVLTNKLEHTLENIGTPKTITFEEGLLSGMIAYFDPKNDYIDAILTLVDTKAIRDSQLKVLVDTMHGVSKTSLSIILNTARCDVDVINDRHDSLFGGKLPSPASATLHKLSDMVKEGGYNLGIATDGDADRIGIIDEEGNFIHPNVLIALIYYYLLEYKKWTGAAVRNLSTTHMIDRIAKVHNEQCLEVPVGFKNITQGMEETDALIGGESSGGLTIRGHISGKDGIFAATLLVEMISVTKKPIHQLVMELEEKYGKLYGEERDYAFDNETKQRINQLIMIDKINPSFNPQVSQISYMDGIKYYFEDGSWLSARFSGTEPLLRIFAEANTKEESLALIKTMEAHLKI